MSLAFGTRRLVYLCFCVRVNTVNRWFPAGTRGYPYPVAHLQDIATISRFLLLVPLKSPVSHQRRGGNNQASTDKQMQPCNPSQQLRCT